MLITERLEAASLSHAARLVAGEHAAALAKGQDLPTHFTDPDHCQDALAALLAEGHRGFTAWRGDRCVGVLCARIAGEYASIRAEGVALDPELDDATAVLAALYEVIAPELINGGALHHHATHIASPAVGCAFQNLAFGRSVVYASQPSRPSAVRGGVDIRIGTTADLGTITALSHVEMTHRFSAPIFSPPHASTIDDVRAYHARLLPHAVHFIARIGADDVGLLTLEPSSPAPRLCPAGQPYIGPTAVHASARSRGVGRDLVAAALDWSSRHGFHSVSVDFASTNPLSRPFWLGSGFRPTGYGVVRTIDASYSVGRVGSRAS